MLDSAASWDAIAYRHAPVEIADRLVTIPLFEAVAHVLGDYAGVAPPSLLMVSREGSQPCLW